MLGKINVVEKIGNWPPFVAIGKTEFYQKTDRFCKKHPFLSIALLSLLVSVIEFIWRVWRQ